MVAFSRVARQVAVSASRTSGVNRQFASAANAANNAFASGANSIYLESIYTQWKSDKASLGPRWTEYFEAMEAGKTSALPASESSLPKMALAAKASQVSGTAQTGATRATGGTSLDASVQEMIRAYQVRGHEMAQVDPLGLHEWKSRPFAAPVPELEPSYYGFSEADMATPVNAQFPGLEAGATLKDLVGALKKSYCGSVGVEYMHIGDLKKVNWIRERVERADFIPSDKAKQMSVYEQLAAVNCFEEFLNSKYKTTKRFGIDGAEAAVSGLMAAIEKGSSHGVEQAIIGMPHRGRLNVLHNVVGKSLTQMFAEFKGTHYDFERIQNELSHDDWSMAGDVKYHLGTSNTKTFKNGKAVTMTLEANPSHLETVNTITLGRTRAKQYFDGDSKESRSKILPILLHGDASFAGQGVVYETMQLASVRDFDVGGTMHVVVNNQVGFTTDPVDDRSTLYCSDIGKAFGVPIFHCNADDPVGTAAAFELAAEWRQTWGMDVVIDVIGYRRYGHNETDAPEYTQPMLYKTIAKHPRSEDLFRQKLISSGTATEAEVNKIKDYQWEVHEKCFVEADNYKEEPFNWLATTWEGLARPIDPSKADPTGLDIELLKKIGAGLCTVPEGFKLHPGLKRQLKKKFEDIDGGKTIDWAAAEGLAFGSLLLEGKHVRLTGQDVQRGTFAHRHCVIKDQANGGDHTFLNNLNMGDQEKFIARNSILSEYGVLGFELGYSYENPHQLNIWEAQFGDFANTAQVMFDQFISAGEHKWMAQSGLVMLLPHGYMGQGAEHSSCRLERFLQLCDDDEDDVPSFDDGDFGRGQAHKANWQVCHLSTPANYFHALRRQLNRNFRKPLVCASPKNLFRLKQCVSSIDEFGPDSHFRRVISERCPEIAANPDQVDKVIFCSGKFYYELAAEREAQGLKNVAIITLEQISPFPFDKVREVLQTYKNVDIGDGVHPGNVLWAQEEPKNMGPWSYVKPRIVTCAREGMQKDLVVRYVGRRAAASPATGLPKLHNAEQESVIAEALSSRSDDWKLNHRPSALLGHQT